MLTFNPHRRISVDEALAHPYLKSLHNPKSEAKCSRIFDFEFEKEKFTGSGINPHQCSLLQRHTRATGRFILFGFVAHFVLFSFFFLFFCFSLVVPSVSTCSANTSSTVRSSRNDRSPSSSTRRSKQRRVCPSSLLLPLHTQTAPLSRV